MSQVTPVSTPMNAEQLAAMKSLAKRGALIDAAVITAEAFGAGILGATAYNNQVPFTDKTISASWDGAARLSIAAGAVAVGAHAVKDGRDLVNKLKALR